MPGQGTESIAAKRYAEAVFGIASDTGTQDQWRDDLDTLGALVQNADAQRYLMSARTSDAEKRRLVEAVMREEGPSRQSRAAVVQRGRLMLAPAIATEYGRMVDAQRGVEHAVVTTAVPLGLSDQAAVAERLRAITGASRGATGGAGGSRPYRRDGGAHR
ncbi:MAG: FoF1 ATP synthase subunit delta [Dehalococcoidia bacterium]